MGQVGRRQFLIVAVGLLATRLACAQSAPRLYRIGYLSDIERQAKNRLPKSLRKGLQDYGWVEGRNFVLEYRSAEGKAERYPALADELMRLKVDIIIAPSEDAALAAKAATQTIPIVMIYPLDPIRLGLIDSYARPGGNVTGLTYEAGSQTTISKQLELLSEAVPGLSRVAVLWNPSSAQSERWLAEMQDPARAVHVELLPVEARAPKEFEPAFMRMSEDRVGALFIQADPMFYPHRKRLAALAVRYRLPTFSVLHKFPQAGGLMTYEVDVSELYARAAFYVDKILRGAVAAELPVEQPTKLMLRVNLKTAKAIGVTIPPSILVRADEVIE